MRRLYLLRHGKSSWDDPGLADRDRPLAPRGERAMAAISEHLRGEGIAPELVLCSPARRTRETLARVEAVLGQGVEVRIEDEIYGASETGLLELLRRLDAANRSVMLIGHNPSIHRLALTLAGSGARLGDVGRKFPTAALATLEIDSEWRDLEPGGAVLSAFVRPKELAG